jgi:hypothetical protein
MKNAAFKYVFLTALALAAAVLASCAHTQNMVAKHPVDVAAPAMCSDCHTDYRAAMNHTADYGTRHKYYAIQSKQACDICHKESFCSDCHAHKDELMPSQKYGDSPERTLPHRGDYLSQHKIDGMINPASCFPCHGRQNNERCLACHRPI